MSTITFEVPEIGTFEARKSLSIIDEHNIENEIDERLNGKYYELMARANKLQDDEQQDIADRIFMQIYIARAIIILKKVIVRYPETINNFEMITDYDDLFSIYESYKKKLNPVTTDDSTS